MNRTAKHVQDILESDLRHKVAHSYYFAIIELWDNHDFSNEEQDIVMKFIEEYYEEILPQQYFKRASEKHFEFQMRVMLASDYIKRKNGRYIPHPVIWFNPNNPHGFAGTKNWFIENMTTSGFENIRFYNENGKMILRKVEQ